MSVPAPGDVLKWLTRLPTLVGAVLLTLLAVTSLFGVRAWQEQQALDLAREHGRQVLDTLDRLKTIITDLESERRGYLLTLDPSYLKAYGVSDDNVRREAQALQALVANDPLQSLRAAHMALTVSAKLREIDDMVKQAAGASGLAAIAMVRAMDETRTQLDLMADEERLQLVDREKRAGALERRKTLVITAAAIIITAFAATALLLARLEADRRRKTTEENVQLYSDLEERDRKIRRLFDSNIIGIMIWEIEGEIFEANDAFLRITGYDREDLAAGRLHRATLTPPEWHDLDARNVAALKQQGIMTPFEKEYFRKDGTRIPVMIGGALFGKESTQGVGFVLDLSGLKRAEAEARENERRYRQAMTELAHANRISTLGQLTASIAHEISQPIAAVVTNAQAGLDWLGAGPSNLAQVRQTLNYIVNDGMRASEVIDRIRGLIKKAPPKRESLEINKAVREVAELTRGEAVKTRVKVRTQLDEGLPPIQADRVQLQQVLLNLMINAIEAMRGVPEGSRELTITTARDGTGDIVVSLRDSGPGVDPKEADRLFDAFFTTKAEGMGMGLAICRSIIEAHGGRLWASANEPRGAIFQFTLPLQAEEIMAASHASPPPASPYLPRS